MYSAKSAIVTLTLTIILCLTQASYRQTDYSYRYAYRVARLESKVKKHSESAQAHYDLGVAYLESELYYPSAEVIENCPKAIETFKQAIAIKPDFAEAYCRLGEAYDIFHIYEHTSENPLLIGIQNLVHTAEEIEAFNKAIELNPNYAGAYVGLGNTYIRSKEDGTPDQEALIQAMDLFNRAVGIDPACKKAYEGLETVCMQQDRFKDAVTMSKNIVLLDIDNDKVYYDLAEYCASFRLCDEVIGAFNEIIEITPNNGKAYAWLGRVFISNQRYGEAADALKQAVRFLPDYQYAHFYLGLAYLRLNNKEGAINEYEILCRLPRIGFPSCTFPDWFDERLLSEIKKELPASPNDHQ